MSNDALEGPDPAADGCQLPATQAMPVVPRAAAVEPAAAAARQAVAAFTAAVRLLPSLGPEVAPDLAAARRLAGEPDQPATGAAPGNGP